EDPGHERSFGTEILADPTNAPNANRIGMSIGVPEGRIAPALGRLSGAAQDHDTDLRSMNTALWQVGWGYYLSNMIGAETGLSTDAIDWARGPFLDYVRAAGPLPALRCGPQPYGILPVTSLQTWAPTAGDTLAQNETWLRDLLVNMRDKIWRPARGSV